MQQPKLTLLTCTHNGEKNIQQVLEAIANQTDVPRDIFEVLVVDNASTDQTSEIAEVTIKRLNLKGRVLQEPRPGKMNAFFKGLNEANAELISIIDDDNFIEPKFIFYTLDIFDRYPKVGMTGSKNTILSDDRTLPYWFIWTKGFYACSEPWIDTIEEHTSEGRVLGQTAVIAGAGSTFRSTLLRNCLSKGYCFFNDSQRGDKLKVAKTGEDLELCLLIGSLGYQFAYDPRIQVRHAINPERLTLENLGHLCQAIGGSFLGCDPFMFTVKCNREDLSFKYTWQWQLLSKLKRYFKLVLFPEKSGKSKEEQTFKNWMARLMCIGAIKRILSERENYTKHIQQVACGEWTELRVR